MKHKERSPGVMPKPLQEQIVLKFLSSKTQVYVYRCVSIFLSTCLPLEGNTNSDVEKHSVPPLDGEREAKWLMLQWRAAMASFSLGKATTESVFSQKSLCCCVSQKPFHLKWAKIREFPPSDNSALHSPKTVHELFHQSCSCSNLSYIDLQRTNLWVRQLLR